MGLFGSPGTADNLTTNIVSAPGLFGIYHFADSVTDVTQIKVTSDLGAYSLSGDSVGYLVGGNQAPDLQKVILSHSGTVSTTGSGGNTAVHHGIYVTSTGDAGKPAGADFQIGVSGLITTDTSATGAVGIYVEGIGGDGGAAKAGGDGPTFLTAGAVSTIGKMSISTQGKGEGSDGSSTGGAHGLFILGQGGDGGGANDSDSPKKGGAGGNASGNNSAWVIGGGDKSPTSEDPAGGEWLITTNGDYSNAVRILAQGGSGGKGGHGDDGHDGAGGGTGGAGAEMYLFYADASPPI